MSLKSEQLQDMLSDAIHHTCDVWYENHRKGGWMFASKQLRQQRLGWNFKQAKKFIDEYDWSWLKDELNKSDFGEE